MGSFMERLRYGFRNWRLAKERVRLQMNPPSGSQATVDEFHRLFYETAYARRDGWTNPKWRGVEALKCPFDLWIYQEMLHELRPEWVLETGTAHGGSAFFLASILDQIGSGQVVSIDIVANPARPAHPRITYLTGSSTSPAILEDVRRRIAGSPRVLVILDSDHRKDHVLEELRLYSSLVTPGSYVIVEDTNVNGHPVFKDFGPGPGEAVEEFLAGKPPFQRDASRERFFLTFNPGGYLRRAP
jgi:cephalosporin hydroxylase